MQMVSQRCVVETTQRITRYHHPEWRNLVDCATMCVKKTRSARQGHQPSRRREPQPVPGAAVASGRHEEWAVAMGIAAYSNMDHLDATRQLESVPPANTSVPRTELRSRAWATALSNLAAPGFELIALVAAVLLVDVPTPLAVYYVLATMAVSWCVGSYRSRINPRLTDEVPLLLGRLGLPLLAMP